MRLTVPHQFDATPAVVHGATRPPMVLHTRVVSGAGGGPDKTILRSARYANPQTLRMAAAYIHPHNDQGIAVLREQARRWNCPLQ